MKITAVYKYPDYTVYKLKERLYVVHVHVYDGLVSEVHVYEHCVHNFLDYMQNYYGGYNVRIEFDSVVEGLIYDSVHKELVQSAIDTIKNYTSPVVG